LHFTVVDASTNDNLDRFYSFGFSGSGFAEVHRSGSEYSVYYTISDKPVIVEIGKEGYVPQIIEIEPKKVGVGSGPLPRDLKVIRLEPNN
jgi:hypothetical protein